VIFALLVSACAPRLAGQGVEARMPAIEGDRYVTRDGLLLGLQHWDAKKPHAILVALHGMSDYSNAYAMPASWWAKHGITTYAYDQRGFGRSPNTGMWAGSDIMRRDFIDFADVVRARHPHLPVFALG
jgi:acylglycerol lipase